MKTTHIHEFRFEDGTVIRFAPIAAVPRFSHRVIVDGVARDWLSLDARPNAKSAEFFRAKHSGTGKPGHKASCIGNQAWDVIDACDCKEQL